MPVDVYKRQVITMEEIHRERILEQFENAVPENRQVLTKYVGDELEILDPYGGALPAYGLCYETLRKSIKKLVKKLNKFWVQIDKDTQLARFEERQNTPEKQWKITDEDWRNREKWDLYETAVNAVSYTHLL